MKIDSVIYARFQTRGVKIGPLVRCRAVLACLTCGASFCRCEQAIEHSVGEDLIVGKEERPSKVPSSIDNEWGARAGDPVKSHNSAIRVRKRVEFGPVRHAEWTLDA